ncbi:hypothetical protein Tco_0003565 [Tanacetum coccineum]
MIVARADNRPPMLEKTMYNSWQNRMLLYIKGNEHCRMMLNSVLHGPLFYGTIEVDGVTRTKTYEELTDQAKLQDDYDVKATNILLMQGTELSQQERECKLYNEFDRFTSVKGYQQVEASFVTDVKLARNMLYIQLISLIAKRFPDPLCLLSLVALQYYSPQQHSQSYEAPTHHQQYQPLLTPSVPQHAYQSRAISQQSQAEFSQLDPGRAVLLFLPGNDPIASFNKAMAFLTPHYSHVSYNQPPAQTSSDLRNPSYRFKMARLIVPTFAGRQWLDFLLVMRSKAMQQAQVENRIVK